MIVTTTERTIAKLDPHVFQTSWLTAVLDDVETAFMVEAGEIIAYANQAYAELLGYARVDDVIGSHLSRLVAEVDSPRLLGYGIMRSRFEPAPRKYQFSARRRDGTAILLHAAVSATVVDRKMIISTIAHPCQDQPRAQDRGGGGPRNRPLLSPRETEVMEMILAGKRMKEIAFTLNLSPKTVSTHRSRMLQKLNLDGNRDLFQYALQHHLVDWT